MAGVLFLAAVAWLAVWRGLHGSDPEMQRLMARLDVADKTKDEANVRASGESLGRVPMDAIFGQADADPGPLDRLETEFSREPDDPSSSDLERRLRSTMGDKRLRLSGIVPEGVDVKCRHDVCRVVANFHDAGDAADWMALYVAFMGTDAVPVHRAVFVKIADGGMQARLFAMQGERVPR
ncbi:MAG TPA: hypothetical protein VFI26_01630 [Lysobacter sp.]|nr:hypothetical protein [Lysobacter sp.]